MKAALVSALCACVGEGCRKKAKRFLEGLSADEMQYIADFLGACILESDGSVAYGDPVGAFDAVRRPRTACEAPSAALDDHDHKIILVKEFLRLFEVTCAPAGVRAMRVARGAG